MSAKKILILYVVAFSTSLFPQVKPEFKKKEAAAGFGFKTDCIGVFYAGARGGNQIQIQSPARYGDRQVEIGAGITVFSLDLVVRRNSAHPYAPRDGCGPENASSTFADVYEKAQVDRFMDDLQGQIDKLPDTLKDLVNDALKNDALTADRISNAVMQVQGQIQQSLLRASTAEIAILKSRVAALENRLNTLQAAEPSATAPGRPAPPKPAPAK